MDNWINTNINDEEKFLNEIREMFTINYINKNKLTSELNKSNKPKPIFILGMPRSGTTLCEQILSSHSIVFGGGELQSFVDVSDIGQTTNVKSEDIVNYRNKLENMTKELLEEKREKYIKKLKNIGANNSYVTDKLPHNFVLIGFIKILFPNAKIIYCKRDKTDNCFSLYTHKFVDKSHGYCYNQKVLGKYYNLHLRLMEYWLNIFKNEIYVLNHEKLINGLGIGDLKFILTPLVALLAVTFEPLSLNEIESILKFRKIISDDEKGKKLVENGLSVIASMLRRAPDPEGEEGYTLFHYSLVQFEYAISVHF